MTALDVCRKVGEGTVEVRGPFGVGSRFCSGSIFIKVVSSSWRSKSSTNPSSGVGF